MLRWPSPSKDADNFSPLGRMVQARTVSMVVDNNSPNIRNELPYFDDALSYSRSRVTAPKPPGLPGRTSGS